MTPYHICSNYVFRTSNVRFVFRTASCSKPFPPPGPPSVPILSFVGLSGDGNGVVNITVSWTLSDGADSYLINITTNAPQTPYEGLLNTTTASITRYELTGFMAGYEYSITVHGVNCGSQEGRESEPLTIRPQGTPLLLSHKQLLLLLVLNITCVFLKLYTIKTSCNFSV